jgi:hypothetical protein
MGTYVLIYVGGEPEPEDQLQEVMDRWMAWFGRLGPAVVDGGNPFHTSASIAPDGTVTMATSSGATGYSILRADDLASALELAAGCPHLAANGTVEVHEVHEMA